jgi:uncharacterized membrane protein YkoI
MSLVKSFFVIFFLAVLSPAYAGDIKLPLTKDTAAQLIQQQTKGKILSVDEDHYQNQTVFSVKVLHHNGKIKIFRLNAETGQQLKVKTK